MTQGKLWNIVTIIQYLFLSKYHNILIIINYSLLSILLIGNKLNYIHIDYTLFFIIIIFIIFNIVTIIYFDNRYEKLRSDNHKNLSIINNINHGIILLDLNNNIIFVNDMIMLLYNKKPESIEDIYQLFNEYSDLAKEIQCAVENTPYSVDLEVGNRNINIHSSVILDEYKLIKMVDITQEKPYNNKEILLTHLLNLLPYGLILANNKQIITFSNKNADLFLNINAVGINTNNIVELQNNLFFKYNDWFSVSKTHGPSEYTIYKIEQQIITLDKIFHQCPLGILIVDKAGNIITTNNNITHNSIPCPKNIEFIVQESQRSVFKEYFNELAVKNNNIDPSIFKTIFGTMVTFYIKPYKSNYFIAFLLEDNISKTPFHRILHEQRIYTIGELTGSISHDFNNHIMSIISVTESLLDRKIFNPSDKTHVQLMNIKHNASRACNLIKQILNLSNKSNQENDDTVDVNEYISDFLSNIGRVLTEGINVQLHKSSKVPFVNINDIYLEQILINLVNNSKYAIDKMSREGVINIYTDVVNFPRFFIENGFCVSSGDYVVIAIEDNGCGISTDNIKKIFEPFFSTKNRDGTGLGLFSINTILKQYKGFAKIKSNINIGTKFMIYLRYAEPNIPLEHPNVFNKSILFVEDEEVIRNFAQANLLNYNVVFANDSISALNAAQDMSNIDLLVTDLMLSTLSGVDLYNKLKIKFPKVKVLFISGYGKNIINIPNSYFLQKPFSMKEFKKLINVILEESDK